MGKKKQSSGTYKLQRYFVRSTGPGDFRTIESSKDRAKIVRSFHGWGKQLPGADLRVVTPSGLTVKKRFAGVFKKRSEQAAYNEKRRRRK